MNYFRIQQLKKNNYKGVTDNESKLYRQLADTSMLPVQLLKESYGIGQKRLDRLEKLNYIKVTTELVQDKKVEVIRLSKRGKSFAKNDLKKMLYKANDSENNHNFKLTLRYLKLNEDEKESYVNETEIAEKYKDVLKENENAHSVDGVYTKTQIVNNVEVKTLVSVEVITENYTQQMIQQRVDFAVVINSAVEIIKA